MKLSIKAGQLYEVHNIHAAPGSDKPAEKPMILIIGARRDPDTHQLTTLALIRCDKESTPWTTPYPFFEERVTRGEFVEVDSARNPAAPGIRCIEDLQDEKRQTAFKKGVQEKSALIGPVLSLGWEAFDAHERNKVIRQVALGSVDGKRHSIRGLNASLWRFWAGGALALGPQYYRCGAHSRAEIAEMIRNNQQPKYGRRAGRTVTVITPKMAARPGKDRGGSYIDPFAEAVISSLITDYTKDPLRRKEIELSLERRRRRLPWTAIQTYVNGELSAKPSYSHIYASVAQIRYIGAKNVSILEIMKKVMGDRFMRLHHRPTRGDYRDVAFYAGHRYEVDGVRADIHLVDDITRMPIGRPNIVFIVDTYSGMITGVYVTVEELTFAHVARALHCAFSPKPAWCSATVDLVLERHAWPCDYRCDHVTSDNAQFLTLAAQTIPELVADSGICPAYRPDLKGLVESTAELANIGVIHLFSYGVTKGPKERAKDNVSLEATVTLQTFTRELVRWVVEVANHRPLPADRELDPEFVATGLEAKPINVWNWSKSEHGGPPHVYDTNTWMPRLLERVNANVTERGLEVDGVYFDLPQDEGFQLMKAKASVNTTATQRVHVDRLTTRQIYLVPDDIAQPPVVVPLSDFSRNCRGLSFLEAKIRLEYRNAQVKEAKEAQTKGKHKQTQDQADATRKDREAIANAYGSIGARNQVAKGTDLEKVKKDQARRDNEKAADVIHGPAAPVAATTGDTTAGAASPSPSKGRPGFFKT